MAAIVAGHGLGLFNTSANILGGGGALGLGLLGQAGGRSFVNAATGNLILQFRDEQLAGRGLDLLHLRTYNSRGAWSDGDTDGWRWDGERSVRFIGAAPNQADTSIVRTDGDGNESTYHWDSARNKYVSTAGGGAHDTLELDHDAQQWLWTEGGSRVLSPPRRIRDGDVRGMREDLAAGLLLQPHRTSEVVGVSVGHDHACDVGRL